MILYIIGLLFTCGYLSYVSSNDEKTGGFIKVLMCIFWPFTLGFEAKRIIKKCL